MDTVGMDTVGINTVGGDCSEVDTGSAYWGQPTGVSGRSVRIS
jgi:hypothetical protein